MRIPLPLAHSSAAILVGCLLWASADTEVGSFNPFPQLIHEFQEDRGNLRRYYRFRYSQLDQDRLQQFYQDYQAQLEEISFDRLNQEGRVDYLLLRNLLEHELAVIEYEQERSAEVADWLDFAPAITALAANRRRAAPLQASAAATTLTDLHKVITSTSAKLGNKETKLSPVLASRVKKLTQELRSNLAEWVRFYDGYDPEFNWWNNKPYQNVETAFTTYLDKLQERMGEKDAVIGDPIGRTALMEALRREFIAYTPEELIDIAEQEYAWCQREWRRVANDLGFKSDWKKALEHVKGLHVDPGQQPALIKELADEAVDFLETRDLVTIPPVCKETWRMEMMTAQRQKVNPYFTGGEVRWLS